ncbi:MAG: type II secretion system secretin GspD [Deltaproteobacteria bacterium]|nr:type II secretion system secretin GspD [Deltaproteobacteria bacterium]
MTTLILTCLLHTGSPFAIAHSPAAAQRASEPGPQLVAQSTETEKAEKAKPTRPGMDSVKKLRRPGLTPNKGGKFPAGMKGGFTGGPRVQPVKPSFRPRTGRPDRPGMTPGARPGRAETSPPKAPAGPSRKLKGPSSPLAEKEEGAEAGAEPAIEEGGKGRAGKLKDKKCRPLPAGVKVRMNFNEAEVLEIVQWISEQTCKNFIIGDNIRGGKITILSNTPVTANEAYRAFLSALNVNNMTVVQVGRFYKIQMKREATKDTIPTYIGEEVDIPSLDLMVTRLVQLKYIDVNTVNGTVKQLTTKDGDSFPYAPTNSLIISDTGSNISRIMRILEQLDTPLGQEEIRVIQVNFAMATELAQTLEEIFGQKGKTGGAGPTSHRIKPVRGKKGAGPTAPTPPSGPSTEGEEGVSVSKIIADERTNQLIVVATARSFARLQELIDKLDVPVPGEGQIQVVYLEHADAEDLSSTLTSLAQGTRTSTSTRTKTTPARPKGPTATKAAELFQGEVKVTADKATNSLVIVASQSDFKSLLKVVKKLDIQRRQVFVEAVIMEVNMDNSRDVGFSFHGGAAAEIGGETVPLYFGTQFKVQGQNVNSLVPNISLLGFMSGLRGPDLPASESILSSISLPSFGVALQALQTNSNVNVLSTPHILTSDNEEAEIMVGENIPIPAGYGGYGGGMSSLAGLASLASQSGLTTGATSGYSGYGGYGLGMGLGMGAINRQEVGLTLRLKPQINEGDYIRIELEEELSEVKDTSNPLGPTTTKRSAKTVVVVKDQQTVVVGGLMRDKVDIGETKVPVLGDIPVLGWFFRSKSTSKTKTNLLLFLTPYVIETQEDFRTIFERKIRERREFMERFYEAGPEYEAFVDYRRKHGPLADIHIVIRQEMAKIENGGPGQGAELLITPDGSGKLPEKPAPITAPPDGAPAPAPAAGEPPAAKKTDGPQPDRLEVE